MAILGESARLREQKRAEKEINALQRKMELQNKKAEFGEGWKGKMSIDRQKLMVDLIGEGDCPKLGDSIDINAFLNPIDFYKNEETGEINKFDYKTYLDAEKAYAGGIEEQDLILADEDDVKVDILDKINEKDGKKKKGTRTKKGQKDKKNEGKDTFNVPEYLQKCYTRWMKYFGRFVPLYNKYVCTCCGRPLELKEYYLNYNELDLARIEPDGKMHLHVCKDCCKRLYEYMYFERADEDGQLAMTWFCSALNIYYDETIYLQAKQEATATKTKDGRKKQKQHIVDCYMNIMNQSATAKGKTFLESKDIQNALGNKKDDKNGSKDKRIINSEDGSVGDDTENGWNKRDLEAKRLVLKNVGYDPFYFEPEENRKILYKDLLGMLEAGMELDGLKVQAACQIVLAFSRIRELNERERRMMSGDGSVAELKNLADLKNKQLDTITKFSRDNGFRERYAISKAKRENSFTGIMAKMNEMKYEDAILNMYDIETSKSIEQAANASFKAIFNQLSMSDAEYAKQCTEQLQRIQKLTREKDTLQEENRKLKYEMAKRELEEKAKEIAEEKGSEWGGY